MLFYVQCYNFQNEFGHFEKETVNYPNQNIFCCPICASETAKMYFMPTVHTSSTYVTYAIFKFYKGGINMFVCFDFVGVFFQIRHNLMQELCFCVHRLGLVNGYYFMIK